MIAPLVEAVIHAGLETIEITMNTAGAADLIKRMNTAACRRLTIGAGTVLNMDDLKQALDAGASFIVMPTLVDEVTAYCAQHNIPFFPGALTPHEIKKAWDTGATMVKVFPAKFFGPTYFREIKGPFGNVKLMACGGVTAENIDQYFINRADAVSFGASVFQKELLEKGDYKRIEETVTEIIGNYRKWKA
ncbi:MAG: bifunctional 4-hydroxy-2-oxoglutarate aldolase/2-dehydro-3-deoxy-phosphogluconate aldolase [Candidatus Brocadiaceae bacterium]|nr:bifunctional 4-hydroxy-2-oxoglutarate aldolase/2-dehydro-3-deoxy-phosphogluconate aldolase [Candidatus Brocadiaceae bacterium]